MEILRVRREYSVWVWNKEKKKYFMLPCRVSSYDEAIAYHDKEVAEWACYHKHMDYDKFQIKMQEITYSNYEVLYG